MVRFLASPDPVTKYSVFRSTQPGFTGEKIGEVAPAAQDTLSFGDLNVVKGSTYFYSISTTSPSGAESGFSDQSAVAYPALDLPDTIRSLPGFSSASFVLNAKAHPLLGLARMDVQIEGSSRFNIEFVEASRTLFISSKLGQLENAKVKVRASYYGQFIDVDSTLIIISTVGVGVKPVRPGAGGLPTLSFQPNGSLTFSNLPGSGELRIFTPQGATAFRRRFTAPDGTLLWNGSGISEERTRTQSLSYQILDDAGRQAGSGRFHLVR
jgi:hypothetical protein